MKRELGDTGKLPEIKRVREVCGKDCSPEEIIEGVTEFMDYYYAKYGNSVV